MVSTNLYVFNGPLGTAGPTDMPSDLTSHDLRFTQSARDSGPYRGQTHPLGTAGPPEGGPYSFLALNLQL